MTGPTRRQRRAIVLLLLVSATFVTLDYQSGSFSGLRSATETVFGPIQRGVTAVAAPVGRFLAGIPEAGRSQERIDELETQIDELERQLGDARLTGDRLRQLAQLGLLAGRGQYRIMPAVVVSLGPSLGFEWAVTIDAGSRDGVRPDMTVLNGDGLVGRVKQVSPTTAVVVLAADPGSSAGVRVEGTNQLGVASGAGLGPLSFSPLDPQVRVRVGDRLVTGPYGATTYVAGVPVGEVSAVSGEDGAAVEASVRPYVTFSALDLVGVVLAAPRTDPRDSVLPPRPATGAPPSSTGSTPSPSAGSTTSGTP